MKTKHGLAALPFLVLLFVAAIPAGVMAQQPVDIKITTIQLKQQQMGVGIERLATYVKEALGNKVRVRAYPAAQLYSGKEEIEAVLKGEVQIAYVLASIFEPIEPSWNIKNLPFLFPNDSVQYAVFDGPVGKRIYSKFEQKGAFVLAMVSSGSYAIHNSKHPIKKPDDFKGLKMRSPGPMGAVSLKAMGAMSMVSVPEEMYTSFQQGMIDGGLTPSSAFYARRLYDVQKYVTNAGTINSSSIFLVASKAWWDKLPADVRAGVWQCAKRLEKEQRVEIEQDDKQVFDQIAAKGGQVYTLTPADVVIWRKALQPVYTEFTPKIGVELVQEVQQEVERITKGKK
jgi:C4-dicarboxylate-binding protein DctP